MNLSPTHSLTLKPIADRVAQNLEIISKNFQFSTRIHHLFLSTNRKSHGQNSGWLKKMQKYSRDSVPPYERWGAGVEYHFQEFNEPYAPS